MQRIISEALKTEIRKRICSIGVSFDEFLDTVSEFAVFGSFGLVEDANDIDIFTVCNRESVIGKRLDLICMDKEAVLKPEWLESELANHIASYGTWLKGNPDWVDHVSITSGTVSSKRNRIINYLSGLFRSWSRLSQAFKEKHSVLLRRQLQRLDHLKAGQSTPPTFVLDDAWKTMSRKDQWLMLQVSDLGIDREKSGFCLDVVRMRMATTAKSNK